MWITAAFVAGVVVGWAFWLFAAAWSENRRREREHQRAMEKVIW